ncbi:extracellular solute-binding protein [Rhizobium sp. BK418]|uniref:ABC transporter substrate-binding protein n=1 Tax=Rhizobium sp. BK418 TaxID=2512120 RepID=UPI00104EC2F0|nr:extracellular solute-binding protein [Rhizobium sp. BK418]TCR98798.1 carbohydrate ABC transporter substrate-binding protein (CUT1 family) [Rhizobium sp. BK418]
MTAFKACALGFVASIALMTPALAQEELLVWVAGEPGSTNVYDKLAESYNSQHPGVNVSIVKNSSDIFNPALVPALSAGEGPDLFTFGTGPGQPASLIQGGLVADLTPYYKKFGWGKNISESIENVTSSNGKLWAVGNEVESTAVFYNKDIFSKAGIEIPKNWESFEAAVKKLKDAGYDTPIGLGGADKWPISHIQSMLFGRYAGPDGIEKVIFGDGSWTDEPFLKATEKLQKMAADGYFGPYPVGTGQAETLDAFWAGQIPMMYTGSFVIGQAVQSAGDRLSSFGVFQMPPLEDGQKVYPTEAIGSGWYIRKTSKKQDQAADFLNYMFFSKEGRVTLLNDGTVPIGPLEEESMEAKIPSLLQAMNQSIGEVRSNGTIPAYLDTIMPANVTNVTYDGLQALLLNSMTPRQFVEAIEKEWETAKKAGNILAPGGINK